MSFDNVIDAYRANQVEQRLWHSKVTMVIAWVLVGVGVSIDYIFYPQFFHTLLKARLLCLVMLLMVFALNYMPFARRFIGVISLAGLYGIALTMCVMVFFTGGVESTYFGGLNLVIIGASAPYPQRISLAFSRASTRR